MKLWKSVVGKLWMTIIGLVALVLIILGMFLLEYIDLTFANANAVKRLFIYIALIGFSLTTFFAFFLSTKITEPLLQLKTASDRISQGDYASRVTIRSTDEIGELAKAFNLMAGQLQTTITDLKHEKEHLGSVLRSMNDAVITFDAQGLVILTNPQGERLVQDWSGMTWGDEPSLHATPEPLRQLFSTVLNDAKQLNTRLHVQNGVYSVVVTPMYANDTVRGAVAVLRDVTEEYRLEKLRKDFVANVSHELRTPLSMLQGYSEALVDDIAASPEERQGIARIIHDESLRMGRLVNNLLDLARMETGHFEMNCDYVDIKALCERVHRKFSTLSKECDVHLLATLHRDPLHMECGDEDRLEQVLTNLLDNALRHTPGGKQIEMRAFPQEDSIVLEVADQGTGIPAEDLEFIFERFYKADKARTRGGSGGTGLGLAIVKNIVEAHRGTVSVESEPGKGTTFSIRIPCKKTN